ncbi:MAG: hypothetical protein R3F20_17955 [Planctomycetota bacterium]
MRLTGIGLQGYQNAQGRLEGAATKIVRDGPDVDAIVELKQSEQAGKLSTEIIKRGIELEDSLLDILA